jgi:tetratricopeptide (TPR) repeat protein
MFLGIAQYQMNKPEEAAASLELEVAAQPDSVESLNWLGLVQLSAGHAGKAAEAFDRAVSLTPNDQSLQYYRGKAHAMIAKDAYQQLYKIDPDSWLVHRALGESLAESGQPEKAIGEFEEAVKKQPNNSDLYEELGESYQKMSRFDDAIKAYQQQVKLNPHGAIALYNLGKIQVERGDAATGVALLRQAIDAHMDAAPAYFYLGTGLAALHKNEEAVTWLEKAMQSHPSQFIQESAEYELVRVYQKLGRKEDAQRAAEELKRLKAASSPGKANAP